MRVKLIKDKFTAIDGAFLVLKEDHENQAARKIIKDSLESCFGCYFDVELVSDIRNPDRGLFVMSVFPDLSTMERIIDACSKNSDIKAISKLWESNKRWTIEIDEKILNSSVIEVTEKELTAILLHEVGHIVCSNSIPTKISLILRYEIAKTSLANKMLMRDKLFSSLLSLPILDACTGDNKRDKSSIKEEIKADTFVKKMGYDKELSSVLNKLITDKKVPSMNQKIKDTGSWALATLDDIRERRDNLAKKNLLSLKTECFSPYICNTIDNIVNVLFEDGENFFEGQKIDYIHERMNSIIEDGYFTEFFIFKKHLKPISAADIDYIEVKMHQIITETDKMMLIGYIHNKLDMVEYYLSILNNPKTAKKYSVPHSIDQLNNMHNRLENLREMVLKYKIPERHRHILVSWADGYEG